jgi:hypothetical protein
MNKIKRFKNSASDHVVDVSTHIGVGYNIGI